MKRIYIFRIALFILILIIPVLTINLKPDQVSTIDNKKLTEFSDILSGDFTTNAENYIDDRIGFRTQMINFYTRAMDSLFGYMVHPNYQYGQDGYIFTKLSREGLNKEYQDTYSDFILKVQNYCEDRGIDFLYAVEPSKATVYPEYLPKGVNYQNINLNYFLELLEDKNVNYVYTGDALIKAKSDYQVYDKKYDANHWNETGAIVGISAILDRLHNMNPKIKPFDINNYSIDTVTRTTLPVSYFPINEDSTIYNLKGANIETIDTFNDKIKISEHYTNFAHYINTENPDAPKILVFAGSYFNGKHKFLTESFSEFVLVHNYYNVFNIDYYIDLFDPDVVLFESTEYTHNSTYFDQSIMDEISYNKPLSEYENLEKTNFTNVDGDVEINDNGAVTDFIIPISNNDTLYSYALINNRVLDCRTITDDKGNQSIEFSTSTLDLSNISEVTIYTVSKSEKEYSEFKVSLQ